MVAGVFSWVTDLTELLGDWAANRWFLLVIFTIALLDSVVPVVPGETSVIIGGVAVATGEAPYGLGWVIAAGALGAFLGDNLAYLIGRRFAGLFERRAARKEAFGRRLRWAEQQIAARGGPLLITARFIPGGRTIITTASGVTRQRWLWFARWALLAAVVWATYAAGLARIVGAPFRDNHTAAFWAAFGTAISVTLAIEVIRHLRMRRKVRELEVTDGWDEQPAPGRL